MNQKVILTTFLTSACLFVLIANLILFSVRSLFFSAQKPFWSDEAFSFNETITKKSIPEILISGPKGQGSPSPLDYLIIKSSFLLKNGVNYFGLQPLQYLRLHNITLAWIVFLYLFYLISKSHSFGSQIAFLVASVSLLFNTTFQYYASEMRPYSLWAILSFLVLMLSEHRSAKKLIWLLALMLLSLTATGSIFQFTVLVGAVLLSNMILGRTKGSRKRLFNWESISFALAFLINLYYISLAPKFDYPTPQWQAFFSFWRPFFPALFTSFLLTIYYISVKNKEKLICALTIFGWLAIGPISFYQTQAHGFFFDPRQYIYYYPAISVLLFLLIQLFISLSQKISIVKMIVCISGLVILPFIFKNTSIRFQDILFTFHNNEVLVPLNYRLISQSIPHDIPQDYKFIPADQDTSFNYSSETNLSLWWTYLLDKFPESQYPRRSGRLLEVTAVGNNFALLNIKDNDI